MARAVKNVLPADFFGSTPVHVGKDSKVLHSVAFRDYENVYVC